MWKALTEQLGHPTRSVSGWLISKFLKAHNRLTEENAVKLSGIQPGDTVLELGHGPGLGLEAAAKLLTAPTGKLIGVDFSEYMHQVKCKYSHSVKANAVFHVYVPTCRLSSKTANVF